MKKFGLLFSILILASKLAWGQVTWTGAAGDGLWTSATNWSGSAVPISTDIVQFNNGGSLTITAVPTVTIQQLILSNSTIVNLQAGAAANVLTIGGGTGTDLDVPSGSAININGTNAMTITVATGSTGSISGSMTYTSAIHKLFAVDANGITFNNGSTFTQGVGCTGNVFGTTNLNSIVFASGSTFIFMTGSSPFGATQPNSVLVFQSGSLYKHQSANTPGFSGRTYANFELNISATTITVTGGVAVSINDLTITAGTLNFNMTGTLGHAIKGNISVASGQTLNFAPLTAGTVNLNGTALQTISGTGTISSTANSTIVINNSNGIALSKDLTLLGTLTLTSGKLTLGSSNLTVTTLSGASNTNYVVTNSTGALLQNIAISSNKTFPVGTASTYAPVTIYNQDVSSSDNYSANVASDVTGSNSGSDRVQLKWTIGRAGSTVYQAMFQWPGSAEGANFAANRATYDQLYDMSNPTTNLYSSSNLTNDPYTLTSVNTLNANTSYGIGNGATALPVELTSFSATTIGSTVKLSWNTATEVNNYGFEIERKVGSPQSTVGNYEKIGFINGNGNSNSQKSYSFEDNNVTAGKYSYRLKQIDNDGQFEYSKTIEVDMNGVKEYELTQNYPNPFNPTTTISFILPQAGMVRLILYNILGQEVRTLVNEVKEAGTHTINLDAGDLNSGMYIYKIEAGSFVQTRKMTLIK